jgi:hypothetical protein
VKSIRANLITSIIAFFALAWVLPAFAADIPDDDEQDVLIRTTLLTFNDANMTSNYAVMLARASKQFQSQFTVDKMATAFEVFRKNKLFFEEVATADY